MRATVDKITVQVKEFFSGLSPKDRNRLIILGVLIIALSILAAWLLGRTTWVTLEAGLTPAMAGQYKTAIEEMGYTCRLADGGTTIEVPEGDRTNIFVGLSNQGITGTNALNPSLYESWLDRLGITDRDRRLANVWQVQSWLQQILTSFEGIRDATVLLTVSDQQTSILQTGSPPTASVVVGVEGGQPLSENLVQSIVAVVAGSWENLTAENITLADKNGNLYDATSGEADNSTNISQRLALESQIRSGVERQLTNLFTPVVGAGNVRVQASVELDMDSTTIHSIDFEPPVDGMDEGLKVSLYELWESTTAGDSAVGVPGTDTNGIGTVEYPYLDMDADEYYRKYVREINYELDETRTEIIKAKGSIRHMTVSVVVNSAEITEDYTEIFSQLSATALGINNSSNVITVAQLPFVPVAEEPAPTFFEKLEPTELISVFIKALVVLLLGLAIISFLRSLYKARHPEPLVLAEATGINVDYVAEGELEDLEALLAEDELGEDGEEDNPLLETIDLRAKDGTMLKLENFIERDPSSVVQLLRNWLSDD